MKMRYDYETMKKSRNYVKKSRSYLHIIFHNQISQFSNMAVNKIFCRISVNNIQCHTATSKYFWSHCFKLAIFIRESAAPVNLSSHFMAESAVAVSPNVYFVWLQFLNFFWRSSEIATLKQCDQKNLDVAVWHWIVLVKNHKFVWQTATFKNWRNWLWLMLRSLDFEFLTQMLNFSIV